MSPAASESIRTPSGASIAVYRAGEATRPTVVLVHGFPDDHTVWDRIVVQLAAHHHVATYDVRGAGGSSKPKRFAHYRLDVLAEDLQAVIDHVNGGNGVHLVGHDWGSVQGWHLVTDPAHRGVLSYTSIAGPCIDHLRGWIARKARARRWLDIVALWKSPLYMGLLSVPLVAPLLCRLGLVDLAVAAATKVFERPEPIDAPPANPSARRNAASVRIYAANLPPRLMYGDHGGTEVPVQVLAPTGDIFVPPVCQRDPHPDITTIRVEPVPGGHWAPAHNATAVARYIASWIHTHDTTNSPASTRRTT
jgi:pimeloyl-ACP methyl ester carboxylesterase